MQRITPRGRALQHRRDVQGSMGNVARRVLLPLCLIALIAGCSRVQTRAATRLHNFNEIVAHHPAGQTLRRLFPSPRARLPGDFAPTMLTRKDYLRLIAGIVDFWKQHQNADGAIIDFYETDEKNPNGMEKQYSTPAFALAAAELVKEARRDDLLGPAVRAFSFALTALQNQTTADQHPDFYIPMLTHAHRILKTRVSPDLAAKWEQQFRSLVPEIIYHDSAGGGNWSIVNTSGEAMRRKDRLVATTQMAAQQDYLDRTFERQRKQFTKFGMYADTNASLAYDAFPRLWLEETIADGAYEGPHRRKVEEFLALGGFSSLLLMSPQGEWVCGGRSGHHQWNEAQSAVIAECNASKWKAAGRDDIAGSFKRMARMCLKSMLRWQRPSGELWIVKNFAEPRSHFGFEIYSFNSQYNLLPAAMLAIACERADDSIDERPMPSEYGSYVFDVRDPFTTVVAAAGGYYVQINTNADSHYNAIGLQRVHRRGVELSPLTDSTAEHRAYIAPTDDPGVALTPGIQWKDGEQWIGLANFHRAEPTSQPTAPPQRVVKEAKLTSAPPDDRAVFNLEYVLDGPGARPVQERYIVSSEGIVAWQIAGEGNDRFVFPVLVNDGARDTKVELRDNELLVTRAGGKLRLYARNPPMKFVLAAPRIATHNGYVQAASVDDIGDMVRWHLTLEPAPLSAP